MRQVRTRRQALLPHNQRRFLALLGLIMGLRELSMTMLNPFISAYSRELTGGTPLLAGIALGIYGLTNGIFQMPYGMLSDRFGRKRLLAVGLLQLFFGLLIAGLTSNMYVFIFARALQGSGALMGVAYAWIGDRTTEETGGSAMSLIGMIVAPAAIIAFVIGPPLNGFLTLKTMFFGSALLTIAGFAAVFFLTHDELPTVRLSADTARVVDRRLFCTAGLGLISNHVLASLFFVLPDRFTTRWPSSDLWFVFAPALLFGLIAIRVVARMRCAFKGTAVLALFLLFAGAAALDGSSPVCLFLAAAGVLSGFMLLTVGLPNDLNHLYSARQRGMASGILQTFTFIGFFSGSFVSGLLSQFGASGWIAGQMDAAVALGGLCWLGMCGKH
ncbi:MAG: MFS transporter [Sporolactobacillus sp.]